MTQLLMPKLIAIAMLGCAIGSVAAKPPAPMNMRFKSAQWHMARAIRPTDPAADDLSLPSLIGMRRSYLKELLEKGEPPTAEEMHGQWRGLNKGVFPAMAGISQFTKEFWTLTDCPHGDNITVCQQDPSCWYYPHAWRPALKDGQIDRHGNFKINFDACSKPYPQAVELNYGQASNPKRSPERLIVDKLVKLDNDHLLGLATLQVGRMRVPALYFVLERVCPCQPVHSHVPGQPAPVLEPLPADGADEPAQQEVPSPGDQPEAGDSAQGPLQLELTKPVQREDLPGTPGADSSPNGRWRWSWLIGEPVTAPPGQATPPGLNDLPSR